MPRTPSYPVTSTMHLSTDKSMEVREPAHPTCAIHNSHSCVLVVSPVGMCFVVAEANLDRIVVRLARQTDCSKATA
jgi:hypothetical protein